MDKADWQQRLTMVVETMREMSAHTDPESMVRDYAARMRKLYPTDRMVALSRRDLPPPKYRMTRSTLWKEAIDPWRQTNRLPVFEGGLLGELIYAGRPRIMNEVRVSPEDPAASYFEGMQSLIALPNFDRGEALNMVVLMKQEAGYFDHDSLPDLVQMSNLFGRATQNLVLSERLRRAYDAVDQEMQVVAEIQRSLLPAELPAIPGLDLAVHYQTSRRAGGDYYDFFPLPEGRWGILIADVSGHGTPAAVIMAITHSIAHTYPGPPVPPARILTYVNEQLANRYTANRGTFVTAFYGMYDPVRRRLRYACAGHNPPRLKRCDSGALESLDQTSSLPLGITPDEQYHEGEQVFRSGDQVIFYTDGITETQNPAGELFGLDRLDGVLACCRSDARDIVRRVLKDLETFSAGRPADDDRTLLVAKIL